MTIRLSEMKTEYIQIYVCFMDGMCFEFLFLFRFPCFFQTKILEFLTNISRYFFIQIISTFGLFSYLYSLCICRK